MASEFETVFARLRTILQKHAGTFLVKPDAPGQYGLQAMAGPAALQAWGGKRKSPMISIAWVSTGKVYVSYHLMGIYGNTRLLNSMSKKLKARMQGKTCFNFKSSDELLFEELEQLTVESIAAFQKAGYINGS
jgi:hypothetical protein